MNDEKKTKKVLIQELKDLRTRIERSGPTSSADDGDRKFRQIIDSIPAGIHMYELCDNGDLVFIGANPAADRILGIDNGQFIGKTIEEAFPPLQKTEVPTRYREAAAKGTPWSTEQIVYRDERIAGAFEVNAFQIEKGIMAAAFFDTTARKQQEESLRENEEQTRSFFNSSPVSLWVEDASEIRSYLHDLEANGINDLEGYFLDNPEKRLECIHLLKVIDVNRKTLEMFNAADTESFVLNIPTIFTENAIKIFMKIILGLYRKNMSFEYGTEFLTLKGETVTGIVRAVVVPGHEETLSRVLVTINDITAIRSAEDALITSNERLKFIITQMPVACMVWDRDLRVEVWNPGAEQVFGYPAHEAIGEHVNKLIIPSIYQDEYETLWKHVGDNRLTRHSVMENVRKDGLSIVCEWHCTPVYDRDRNVLGMLSIAHDITERRNMEEALRESEERFRTIFDSALDGVLLADIENRRFIVGNPSICRMLGYQPEEILDLGVNDIHRKEDLPYVVSQFEKQSRKEINIAKDIPVLRKDGTVFYADISSFPIALRGRMCLVGFFRDVTYRREAEERLLLEKERAEDEKAKVESILSGIGDGICILDREFRIIYQNEIHKRLLGEHPGEYCYRAFEQKDGICEGCPVQRTREDGDVHLTERVKRDGDSARFFEITTSPLRNARGEMTAVIEVVRDVTARRQFEAEVQKLQKLESLGILAGGIAHDFNNLLQGLLGNITYARMHTEEGGKAYEVLGQAEGAYNLAQNLTNQLLTFAHGGIVSRRAVNIGQLIRDAVVFTLSGSSIVPVFDIGSDRCIVNVDEGQIRQVVQNIVINAKDAMPRGGDLNVTVQEELDVQDLPLEPGRYVRVSISDNGDGMNEEHVTKIFEPYFTTKEMGSRKGTGLGLTICYSIIKNHNGYIQVSSRKGAGTTFSFYLPVSNAGIEEVQCRPGRKREPSGRMRVLIMDDEDIVTNIAEQYLDHLGYDVAVTRNGEETIALYKEAMDADPFDIVVLDLTIPGGMGGKETLDRLLEIDPGVKAIASSGFSTDPVMTEFEKAGFKGVLVKPYRLKKMEEVLSGIVSRND